LLPSLPKRRDRRTRSNRHRPPRPRTTAEIELERARRERPSEDREQFTCMCGYVFSAEPSTSVGCPHCGGAQAW
jgi:hypothetical protein